MNTELTREKIALRFFCALLSKPDCKLDLHPELGDKQMRTCFMLADHFLRVATLLPEGATMSGDTTERGDDPWLT